MTREPRRIQRRRTKGWRAPEGAVYVGRGTKWGNPFIATRPGEGQQEVVDAYAARFANDPALRAAARGELAGRDLACWCPLEDANGDPVPCHADVLLSVANSSEEKP